MRRFLAIDVRGRADAPKRPAGQVEGCAPVFQGVQAALVTGITPERALSSRPGPVQGPGAGAHYGRKAAGRQGPGGDQCTGSGSSMNIWVSIHAYAASLPGWLNSTISTTHFRSSRSMSSW